MTDPTQRFTDRVEHYIKNRPHYPSTIINLLESDFGLDEFKVVADLGSGTGISAELFLRNGNKVFGVEPNKEMREAAERLLADYSQFVSVAGSAEATTLPDACCDFIVAGQAFHWFDKRRAKAEFQRIARTQGAAVLMWNDRVHGSPFNNAYETFVQQFSTDYNEVNHRNVTDELIRSFFEPAIASRSEFHHHRMMDFDGIKGLLLSSSYMPNATHVQYAAMIQELEHMFKKFQQKGIVQLEYVSRVYCGRIV
jgi:SAM-dependent methyltransferase